MHKTLYVKDKDSYDFRHDDYMTALNQDILEQPCVQEAIKKAVEEAIAKREQETWVWKAPKPGCW